MTEDPGDSATGDPRGDTEGVSGPFWTNGEPDLSSIPERLSGAFRHPERVGPYKILEVLGEGGMGVVYLAEQREPVRRRVALKLIKLGMDTKEVIARFEAERQALAMMNHPNIARVYDAGSTDQGRPYFVMEHVSGVSITEYCDRHQLRTSERLELFVQACGAIQHAHQNAIIHRDIKPSNVLVMLEDGRPVAKVIDFGVAKAVSQRLTEKTLFTQRGAIVGTPEYMSPEQAESDGLDVDTRTDVYSLGVLLYEMLVGALPFESRELRSAGYAEIQRIIREREPLRPSTRLRSLGERSTRLAERRKTNVRSLARELSGDLDWVVMKALHKDRGLRYPSASELAADIGRFLTRKAVLAGPPAPIYRLRKFATRHRTPLLVASLLVIALIALLGEYLSGASLRSRLAAVRSAIADENLDAARGVLGLLREADPSHPDVLIAAERVRSLERDVQIRRSQELQVRGMSAWKSALDLMARKGDLERVWMGALQDVRAKHEDWRPFWERGEEFAAWRELSTIDGEVDRHYAEAVLSLHAALDAAPTESSQEIAVRQSLQRIYWKRYQDAWPTGFARVSADFFRVMARSLDSAAFPTESTATVLLTSDPPGAEVFCFRYQSREGFLFPVPYRPDGRLSDPALAFLGDAFLQIERKWSDEASPFQTGDRFLKLNGVDVRLRGELASVLSAVGPDERVEVEVERDGGRRTLSWVPFPSARYSEPTEAWKPGRVIDIYSQFGFTFAGYPLDFAEGCRIGRTSARDAADALEVELPRGSYLFVLRKDGYADVRYPIAIPSDDFEVEVRLLRSADIPEGFVYVPGGSFACGGDKEAYQSLDEDRVDVPGFFLSRYEVRFRDWLDFVNDPEILDRIDEAGLAEPVADWNDPALRRFLSAADRTQNKVQLIPVYRGQKYLEQRDGRWQLVSQLASASDWPVFGVPMLAGLDYAIWLTRKHGGKWRFRLPTDLEWEKAARGADRRKFVWGEYFLPSYCRSAKGRFPGRPGSVVDPVGVFPLDESVYGIRDLAGSMKEPTSTPLPFRFYVLRGGEWDTVDDRDFRVATRNRRRPEEPLRFVGLRLAADLSGE